MFSKFMNTVNTVLRTVDYRMIVFVLMVVLFILGAGAPGATGIGGGG